MHINDKRLIVYCFTSRSRIVHSYGDVTIAGEGAAKFRPILGAQGLSAGRDLYRDSEPWFFRSHPKDRPIQWPLTTHKGVWRTYSNPDPHGYDERDLLALDDEWKRGRATYMSAMA
jgi:hypothetical protein